MSKDSIAKRKHQWKKGDPIPPPPIKAQQCKQSASFLFASRLLFFLTGHFWLARKRRYCQLIAKRTNKYCGEHMIEANEDHLEASERRVPCPFDPSQ